MEFPQLREEGEKDEGEEGGRPGLGSEVGGGVVLVRSGRGMTHSPAHLPDVARPRRARSMA